MHAACELCAQSIAVWGCIWLEEAISAARIQKALIQWLPGGNTERISPPKKMDPTLLLLSLAAIFTTVTPAKGTFAKFVTRPKLNFSCLASRSSLFLPPVCGRPRVSDGVDVSSMKRVFEIGEDVSLSCEQGYSPSTTTPPRITCTATGEWTPANLACSRESRLLFF